MQRYKIGVFSMKRIAVIGSLNVDYVAYVSNTPKTGETVLSDFFEIVPGGKGANQAFALGRMGAQVAMFGAVGKDANAAIELDSLKHANVFTENIQIVNSHTGIAMIVVDKNGNNSIIVSQGANRHVTTEYIDSVIDKLQEYDIIIMQLEIPLPTVIYATEKLKGMGKTIILDPAPAPGPLPDSLLRNVDYIKPNETELAKLTGITDVRQNMEQACNILLQQGVGCVLASVGEDGVFVATQTGGCINYPAEKVTVVDTTAAGDSFIAAFAFALSKNCSLDKSVQFANQVAGIVVQRKGAQTSIPDKNEIRELWGKIGPVS